MIEIIKEFNCEKECYLEEIKQIKKKLAKTQTEKYETNGKRGRMRSHYEQNKPL
jgi:hypothetical protein